MSLQLQRTGRETIQSITVRIRNHLLSNIASSKGIVQVESYGCQRSLRNQHQKLTLWDLVRCESHRSSKHSKKGYNLE